MRHHGLTVDASRTNEPIVTSEMLAGRRFFVTTVLRGSRPEEMTGYIMELDWLGGEVTKSVPIPLESGNPMWNGRGGNRGGRGMAVHDGKLYVAVATSLLVYDHDLNKIDEISHKHLAGLHEIAIDHRGIWINSTVHDLILLMDFDGKAKKEFWLSEHAELQQELGYTGRELMLDLDFPTESFTEDYDKYCKDERLHLNSLTIRDGRVYTLACRRRALLAIDARGEVEVVIHDAALNCPHNCEFTPDGLVAINDTVNQAVRLYDPKTGKRIRTVNTCIDGQAQSAQFARAGWQRGMAAVGEGVFLVGTSPATVFELDINRGVIGRTVRMDDDVRHCVHGLLLSDGLNETTR